MRTTFLIIVLLTSGILFSQSDIDEDNRLCVKIAPLAILDIYSGMSPRVGIEYKLKNNWALYHELGTYMPYVNSMQNNRGGLIKTELKMYLNNSGFTSGQYFSAELFYKHQSYGTYDSIYGPARYNKDYQVSKNVACFTIKYGFLQIFESNLLIDAFVGLGVRQKYIANTLTFDENLHIKSSDSYGTNIAKNKAGTFTYLNFDAGIKIGYRFK